MVIKGRAGRLRRSVQLDLQEMVDELLLQTVSLEDMLEDVLRWTKPRSDEYRTQSLNGIVERVLQDLDLPAELSLVRQLQADLPPLPLDQLGVEQLLLNLVRNARDAVYGKSAGRITVSTHMANGHVELRVSDNGPGVALLDRKRLFEPFYSTKSDGTGMGLSIVQRVAKNHRGSVRVEQSADGGATFIVRLPVQQAVAVLP
jgi:signal transduction histidine kinase